MTNPYTTPEHTSPPKPEKPKRKHSLVAEVLKKTMIFSGMVFLLSIAVRMAIEAPDESAWQVDTVMRFVPDTLMGPVAFTLALGLITAVLIGVAQLVFDKLNRS